MWIQKPYPNFHAARIRNPGLFLRVRVFQTTKEGIMIYGGPLKSDPSGPTKVQAIRFPKSKFTVAEAKKWLKDHKHTAILFEPASEKKQKAQWTTRFINDLPDSSFLYIAPGGKKDEDGKTKPRSLRYFPYKDAGGKIDLAHLRNAIAQAPKSNLPKNIISQVQSKGRKLLDSTKKNVNKTEPKWPSLSGEVDE